MTTPLQGGWRAMTAADLPAMIRISDEVHGIYTEPEAVLAERLRLYPAGCLTLERDGTVTGYLIAHPWHRDIPPSLGKALGAIPADADTFYLHDLALLPAARGSGAGQAATAFVLQLARAAGFADVTLMAVNGADGFWARQGFHYADSTQASSYGEGTFLMRQSV